MITTDYLQEQINSSKTESLQANLFQGKIAKLKGVVPPIAFQNRFADFVAQADKSKLEAQHRKEELLLEREQAIEKYFR